MAELFNILIFKKDKTNNKVIKFNINNDNKKFIKKLGKLKG